MFYRIFGTLHFDLGTEGDNANRPRSQDAKLPLERLLASILLVLHLALVSLYDSNRLFLPSNHLLLVSECQISHCGVS